MALDALLEMSRVAWLLVVKGNLRHRIGLLGVEKEYKALSETQRALRDIVRGGRPVSDSLDSSGPPAMDSLDSSEQPCPERPGWAGGAFVFLLPEDVAIVKEVIEQRGIFLQSKHVLVSDGLKSLVKESLEAKPPGPGREAFLIRRAGEVGEEEKIPLPGQNQMSMTSRQPDPDADSRWLRRAFFLPKLRLGDDVMEQRDIDLELLEFLTAPVSVQMMDPEKWIEAWELACRENDWWLYMRKDERGQDWPYCRFCSAWAVPAHLTTDECRQRVAEYTARQDDNIGPLLREILTALDKKREQRQNRTGTTSGAGRGLSSESEEGMDAPTWAHGVICPGWPHQQQAGSAGLRELQCQQPTLWPVVQHQMGPPPRPEQPEAAMPGRTNECYQCQYECM